MMTLSHLVNVIVLAALAAGLWHAPAARDALYGPDGPARRILFCIYGAILCASLAALILPGISARIGAVLFPLQIVYKLATVPMLGLRHPVAASNLAIAALHSLTLATTYGD